MNYVRGLITPAKEKVLAGVFLLSMGGKMKTDIIPLAVGVIILISSLVPLKLRLSVAIIEIVLGAAAGNLGLRTEDWMIYLASFGGILLTFLAGTEIDSGIINEGQYSVLIGVVIASAVIPTFIAQKWFMPVHWKISLIYRFLL